MLLTITIVILSLVILNLFLLKFSCNKIEKKSSNYKNPVVLKPKITTESDSQRLAPTGS